MTARLVLDADLSAAEVALSELQALAQVGEGPERVVRRLVHAIERGARAFRLEVEHGPAGRAGDLHAILRAQPSDALAQLVAAVRAGDWDCLAVEQAFGHLESSIGASEPPMVDGPELVNNYSGPTSSLASTSPDAQSDNGDPLAFGTRAS